MATVVLPVYPWFVLRVKSRHEKYVTSAVTGRGFEAYLPLYQKVSASSGHRRLVELPVFPNYVFARFDPNHYLPILTIPGVFQVLTHGRELAMVSPREIEDVHRLCRLGQNVSAHPYGQAGDMVQVVSGPLFGMAGKLVAVKNSHRLVISVNLLQRSVAAEVEFKDTRPLKAGFGCLLAGSLVGAMN